MVVWYREIWWGVKWNVHFVVLKLYDGVQEETSKNGDVNPVEKTSLSEKKESRRKSC